MNSVYVVSQQVSSPYEEEFEQMDTITYVTYEQAREILDVSMQAIKNAALNDVLTRCFHNTKRAVLLREQVELFKGKRLSIRSLSLKEKELWGKYKAIAESPRKVEQTVSLPQKAEQVVSLEEFIQAFTSANSAA